MRTRERAKTTARRATTILLLLWLAAISRTLPAAGWRGPARDAAVGSFAPPMPWPKALQQVWELDVGRGYSSPVVADGRVYLHSRRGDDEHISAVDIETGRLLWRRP